MKKFKKIIVTTVLLFLSYLVFAAQPEIKIQQAGNNFYSISSKEKQKIIEAKKRKALAKKIIIKNTSINKFTNKELIKQVYGISLKEMKRVKELARKIRAIDINPKFKEKPFKFFNKQAKLTKSKEYYVHTTYAYGNRSFLSFKDELGNSFEIKKVILTQQQGLKVCEIVNNICLASEKKSSFYIKVFTKNYNKKKGVNDNTYNNIPINSTKNAPLSLFQGKIDKIYLIANEKLINENFNLFLELGYKNSKNKITVYVSFSNNESYTPSLSVQLKNLYYDNNELIKIKNKKRKIVMKKIRDKLLLAEFLNKKSKPIYNKNIIIKTNKNYNLPDELLLSIANRNLIKQQYYNVKDVTDKVMLKEFGNIYVAKNHMAIIIEKSNIEKYGISLINTGLYSRGFVGGMANNEIRSSVVAINNKIFNIFYLKNPQPEDKLKLIITKDGNDISVEFLISDIF